jgi:hypothetical protein
MTTRMKWLTLQQHNVTVMLCEEGITIVEAKNALSIP